jgi:hypothetical protein
VATRSTGALVREGPEGLAQRSQRFTRLGVGGDSGFESLAELDRRRLDDEPDELAAAAHPLVERGRPHTDPVGHGLHGQALEAAFGDDGQCLVHDLIAGGALWCRHGASVCLSELLMAIDTSLHVYVP